MKKALSGPDQHKAFLRKCWLLIIAVMAFSSLSAQDDSTRFSRINGYGFFYKRMGIDSVLYLPLYESSHTPYRAGAIKYRKSDSSFYKYTGTQWLKVEEGGVATNGIDTVYTINDTVQVIETADETYFTIINSPYTEVLNDSTIIVGNDTLIIAGASGGGIWGEITGTLSDQTDLDAALDAKLEVVTTDATLTGDGTAGDPLKVDTLLISTRAWRQKGIDSLGAIIATKLSAVNLDTTRDATSATILNDAGDDAVIPLVSIPADKAGLISPAMAAHIDSSMRGLLFDSSEVVNIGDGQNLVYSNETKDTLFVKRLKDSRYITYTTDTDSSIVTTFDTAQLRTDMNIPLEGGGGGGIPGGNNTEVQFNDGGAFGGDTGFTFDKTTNEVTVDSLTSYHLYADSMRATLRILAGSAIQPFNSLVTETIEMEAVGDQPIISILDTNTEDGSSSLLWFRGLYSNLTNTKKILGYIEGRSDANGGQLRLFGTAANQTATHNLGLTVRQTGRVVVGASSGSNTARFDVFDATGEHMRLMQATDVYAAFRVFTVGDGILRITPSGGQISTDRLHLGAEANPTESSWMLNVDGSVRINKDSIPLVTSITNEHVLIEDTTTGQVKRISASNLGGSLSGSGVSGEVAFWDGTSSITSDANFLYSTASNGELSVAGKVNAGSIVVGDNRNMSSGSPQFYAIPSTYTDITTAGGGTATWVINLFGQPTIAATNSNVSIIRPATLKVDPPIAGTNVTFTGPPFAITTEGAIELGGGIKRSFGGQTSGSTVDHTMDIITCNATAGNYTITLPDAADYTGFTFTFKRTDNSGNTCTVNTTSAQTIDGAGSYSLSAQYKYVTVVSDGSNWLIIANN